MKMVLRDKEIRGSCPWTFHTFESDEACDKATSEITKMYQDRIIKKDDRK